MTIQATVTVWWRVFYLLAMADCEMVEKNVTLMSGEREFIVLLCAIMHGLYITIVTSVAAVGGWHRPDFKALTLREIGVKDFERVRIRVELIPLARTCSLLGSILAGFFNFPLYRGSLLTLKMSNRDREEARPS